MLLFYAGGTAKNKNASQVVELSNIQQMKLLLTSKTHCISANIASKGIQACGVEQPQIVTENFGIMRWP